MKILNGITLTGNAALDANSLTVGSTQIIATSGRVGIGTTNPTTTLQVAGTITATTFSGPLSGNATTATTLQTARTINATSFNGSANITIDQLYRIDDRAIAPGDITTGYMKFGFGSWNNNSTSPYADFLHFRSYTDSSGGSDNLLMFAKNTIGIRLYQQTYGSTNNYSTYRDVAFTDSPTFTGQVVVAAGTSAAPALTTTGDLNTGMFFPAADTIALTEGGTEVLRITSGSSVGIGTISPTAKLHVTDATTGDLVIFESTDAGASEAPDLVLYRNSASPAINDAIGGIAFRGKNSLATDKTYAQIYATIGDQAALLEDGSIYFNTMTEGTLTEKMRITDVGVGIGATNPTAKLEVSGAGVFSQTVSAATPTATNHLTTKAYVDDVLAIAWLGL